MRAHAYLHRLFEGHGGTGAGQKIFFNAWKNEGWYGLSRAERQRQHMRRPSWWTYPTKNTLDRATAMMPALLRERMDDFGIDFMNRLYQHRAESGGHGP